MQTKDHHSESFAARARAYLAEAARAGSEWYDAAGYWIFPGTPAATRERFWISFALYANGSHAMADAVIQRGETPDYHGVRFNIFDNNIAVVLLALHKSQMNADTRRKLESLVRDGFSFKPGNRQPDYQFHGYNDNMPAKATMGLILGGEMLGHQDAVEYGLWNLRQLRAMLVRRGINSEYNSPTYTPLTLHAMAEIAEHATNEEARALALGIEQRLWIDIAARFHPAIGVVGGPYARAYTVDSVAHLSLMASLLWFQLGDRARPSPMELFDPASELVLHHAGDRPFNIAQMSWLAAGHYHVPNQATELFTLKRYPFRAVASSEIGAWTSDLPGRPSRNETLSQSDFSIGTSDTIFLNGGLPYVVTYRRREPVTSIRDVGTVFNKMVLDDEGPGTRIDAGEEDYLTTWANSLVVPAGNTVLSLSHPQLSLGGDTERGEGWPPVPPRSFSRLSELIIFPSHFGGADEIMVGDQKRNEWGGAVEHGQWIACRRGRLLIAFRPLAYSRQLGHAKITLEKINRYEVIRSTLYHGAKREFSQGELKHFFSGFVGEHAGVDEFPSLAAFASALARGRFSDYYWYTRRVRYARPALGTQTALDLEASWSPGSMTPRYAIINGRPVETPVVQIDGVDARTLPFLNEAFQPVPAFFPWRDFSIEWGDWPWAIGDREI